MNLNSREGLIKRLRRGRTARERFVESNLAKSIAHQLRATRDKLGWSQERLAIKVGMSQNAISRLESPEYGKQTLTTLKRLAAAMDVALIIRFVPFSELIDWISGTPLAISGLTAAALAVPDFESEEREGALTRVLPICSGTDRHLREMPDDPSFASSSTGHMRRAANGYPQDPGRLTGDRKTLPTGSYIAERIETLPAQLM